jgi:hypothetical protein
MEWDQIAENWAAMAKRLCGDRAAGAAQVSVTTSEPLASVTSFASETHPPTRKVPVHDLSDTNPRP